MKLSIVICGWHFKNRKLYQQVQNESVRHGDLEIQLFVASHRGPQEIDKSLLEEITSLGWHVTYFENEGWDWGAFQQFVKWQEVRGGLSHLYLFLHDDIEIKSSGFIKAFLEKTDEGYQVIGNSPTVSKKENVRSYYPEDILWAEAMGFPVESKEWNVVRGSAFFCTRAAAESVLMRMPIKKGANPIFGNCSLRIFGALVTDRFGSHAIGYIGQSVRSSQYINEGMRGNFSESTTQRLKALLRPHLSKTKLKRILRIKKTKPAAKGSGLRVNLGCGNKCLYGYFNVDISSPHADLKADVNTVRFPDNTVAEVLMVHVIEHVDYLKVLPLFEKIYGWLKENGQLVLEYPDVLKVSKSVLRLKNRPEQLDRSPLGIRGYYGGVIENMTVYDYHKWGWTEANLSPLLKSAGFRKIFRERAEYHLPKRDSRLVAVK